MKFRWIAAAMIAFASLSAHAAHVQWESDGLPYVMPPKNDPFVSDPDQGMTMVAERRIEIRGLTMDFKRIGHVEIEVINTSMDVPQTEAWTEIEDVVVVTGFAKSTRGKGLRNFFIQGNGPIMVDLIMKVSNKTDPKDIVIKVKSPYR